MNTVTLQMSLIENVYQNSYVKKSLAKSNKPMFLLTRIIVLMYCKTINQ